MRVKIPPRWKAFLAPPVFADEEHAQRAGLLNVTLLAAAAFLASMLVYRLLTRPLIWPVVLLDAGLLAAVLLLRLWMRRGATRRPSLAFVLLATLGVSLGILFSGRMLMPLLAAYLLIIIIAGLLLDYRAKIVMVALNAALALGVFLAERAGVLSSQPPPVALSWLLTLGLFATGAAVIHLAKRQYNELLGYYRRELAERRRAEEAMLFSDARLRSLLTAIPDFIVTLSPEGRYTEVFSLNPIHEQRRGVTRGELIGRSLHELFPADTAQAFQCVIDTAVETGRVLEHEYQLDAPDGRSAWYQARVAAYDSPEGRRVVWLARDVTENKAAEEALHRLTSELEARVRQRTAQIEAVNRELEAFSYSVSHDLRAPLRAISGYGKLLDEDYGAGLPDDGRAMLARLRQAAAQMSGLIDDLLRLSRLASQQLDRRPVAMRQAAEEAFRLLLPDGQPLDLQIEDMPPTQADPVLVQRIYANLLENAIKYSQPKPEMHIHAGAIEVDGEVVYYVRDRGIGFDMRYADRIFTAFQRLHPGGEFEGSGLGLAITRRIIERHGGRIWAEGQVNQGATFYFTLPAPQEPAADRR